MSSGAGMRRALCWIAAATLSILITTIAFLPAAWLAPLLKSRTAGRIVLGDAQGTLWHGSAFIGAAAHDKDPVTPLLPGRFVWRLSPLVLLGRLDVSLENPLALSQPVSIRGGWRDWTVTGGSISLPAERLAGLGAPLNTLQPSGRMVLAWQPLQLERRANGIDLRGLMTLEMTAMASRVSPIKPLGSYRMRLDWQGPRAVLALDTLGGGPMLLAGNGMLNNGHLQFSGTVQAAEGQEEKLAGLLNFLGQCRRINGKNVIELEFKS